MDSDVIIIGAGALGVSLAYHLAARKRKSLVLEREPSYAYHASGKNAGMIRQLYRHPQLTAWAHRSVAEWPDVVKSRIFNQAGSMIVGRVAPGHHEWLFETETLSQTSQGVSKLVPAVRTVSDGLIDPSLYVDALYKLTDREYARYLFNHSVKAIEKEKSVWSVVANDGRRFSAPWIVNAAGAWAHDFLFPQADNCVMARPYARHLFVVEGWERGYMPVPKVGYYWDEVSEWYLRRWDENSRLVSICDKTAVCPSLFCPTKGIAEKLSRKLIASLGSIADNLRLSRYWHCFRMYTADLLPIWGEDSLSPGLFWLAAFGGFGMSTSYAATEDAAKYICGQNVNISADFLPNRENLLADAHNAR